MEFAERVYAVVRLIPAGCVTSYGSIARALGAPRGARVVGWIMRGSPEDIPAHRVVNKQGVLTGAVHFGPPDAMRQMLEDEGVSFVDDITVDIAQHYWDPADDPRVDELYAFREN